MTTQSQMTTVEMTSDERPDGELLAEIASTSSEACFEELVRRHGAMVLAVCQRMVRHGADAEDAAQAVFLVLWKKAAALRSGPSVAAWLHRVARNICLNANRACEVRTRREREAADMNQPSPTDDQWGEIKELLDDELARLPEKYRLPVILFHLEGRSLEEIATLLNARVSTVGTRLNRARQLLRSRLALRGITISAAGFAALLTNQAGAVVLPATFISTTRQAASLFAAGKAAAGIASSAQSAALAQGALHVMSAAKIKLVAFVSLASVVLITGGAGFIHFAFGMTDEQKRDVAALQGTWEVVAYEKDGQAQPKESFIALKMEMVFDGNKYMLQQTTADGRVVGEAGVTFTLDPTASPGTIDATQKGRTVLGIYELQDDTLKLCVDRTGRRPASFKAGMDQLSYVAKRAK